MDLVLHDQGGFGGVNCVCVHCRYNGGFFCWRGSRAVGFSANYAAGNGVPRAPHGPTLERVAVKTLRVLNADVARAPQADLRKISHKIRASGVNREIMV